jgi:hypothetical protein
MGLQPNIKRKGFALKTCVRCGQTFGTEGFAPTKSLFFPDGTIPTCNDCVDRELAAHDWDWDYIDKLCQMADIPFVPKEWERLREMTEQEVFYRYATVFLSSEYDGIGWSDYYKAFKELKQQGAIEDELPEIAEKRERELKEKWGGNYDMEALMYLEGLFNGLMTTQNVNGALQIDQAKKICKMSYEVDRRIEEGSDFDKLLSSYDKLVKAAEFTPKNVKNINDFDTFGEAIKWLEKRGWRNTFYDGVTRDVVDESMKNFQNFNQRLYTNESNIGEEITRRLEALKNTAAMENESYYGTDRQYDLDAFERDGYEVVFEGEDDEFSAEVDDNGED